MHVCTEVGYIMATKAISRTAYEMLKHNQTSLKCTKMTLSPKTERSLPNFKTFLQKKAGQLEGSQTSLAIFPTLCSHTPPDKLCSKQNPRQELES